MDAGLDTGDMLHVVRTPISDSDTGGSVHDRLATLGAAALVTVLDDFAGFHAARRRQDDALATYARKFGKDDATVDWQGDARTIVDKVRAFNPWPVAQTTLRGEVVRLWAAVRDDSARGTPGTVTGVSRDGIRVACGDGQGVRITQLQLPGRKAMPASDLLNGHPDALRVGDRLGDA